MSQQKAVPRQIKNPVGAAVDAVQEHDGAELLVKSGERRAQAGGVGEVQDDHDCSGGAHELGARAHLRY